MAKGGNLAIMIGLGKKKPGGMMDHGDEESSADEDKSAAEDDAIQSMMDAQKDGDTAAYKDGLKTFLELCYPSLGKGSDYEEGSASGEE